MSEDMKEGGFVPEEARPEQPAGNMPDNKPETGTETVAESVERLTLRENDWLKTATGAADEYARELTKKGIVETPPWVREGLAALSSFANSTEAAAELADDAEAVEMAKEF